MTYVVDIFSTNHTAMQYHMELLFFLYLKLREADTDDKRDSVLSAHGDWMAQQGMPVIWRLKVEDRIKAVANLVKQQIFYR